MTTGHAPEERPNDDAPAMLVQGERTFRTLVHGQLVVASGAVAWVRAPVLGDVTVLPGGRAHLLADVSGRLNVDLGIAVIGAQIAGGISITAGTRPGAVRPARSPGAPLSGTTPGRTGGTTAPDRVEGGQPDLIA